jgi:hypothetical protein
MALNRYVLTADVTVPAGTPTAVSGGPGTVSWSGPGPYPAAYQRNTVIVADPAGSLYAAIGAGNLRAYVQGQDDRGGVAISNLGRWPGRTHLSHITSGGWILGCPSGSGHVQDFPAVQPYAACGLDLGVRGCGN